MEKLNKNRLYEAQIKDLAALFGGEIPEIKIKDHDEYSHNSIDDFTGSSFY
jgi:hypothetical protein